MSDYTDIICSETRSIHQAVGVIVFADTRFEEVYLSKRTGGGEFHGLWQNPGGKLELGETPEVGAARELKEETGLVRTLYSDRLIMTTLGRNIRGHYLFHWYWTYLEAGETLSQTEPDQATKWVPIRVEDLINFRLMPNLHNVTLIAQLRNWGRI